MIAASVMFHLSGVDKKKFMQEVKEEDKPPFPSVPTYDAKAWAIMKKYAKKGALFWNVGK